MQVGSATSGNLVLIHCSINSAGDFILNKNLQPVGGTNDGFMMLFKQPVFFAMEASNSILSQAPNSSSMCYLSTRKLAIP